MTDLNEKIIWVISRKNHYLNIGYIFSGYGTILIEGDSLFSHLFSDTKFSIEIVDKFLKNLKECNLKNYRIVFFETKSKWLPQINGIESLNISIFKDWSDPKWSEYVSEENIGLILTSTRNVFKNTNDQYDLIFSICMGNKIQVALIDNYKFEDMNFYCSLISKDQEFKIDQFVEQNQTDNLTKDTQMKVVKKVYKIENKNVNEILNHEQNDVEERRNFDFISDGDFQWEIKINYRENTNSKKFSKFNQIQKYYRYMEKYATSLDSSKDLHHPIVTNIESKKNKENKDKISNKAEKIKKDNLDLLLKKKEDKQNQIIKNFKITCYDDIDRILKDIDLKEYSDKSLLEIKKLKLKWLNLEPDSYTDKKLKIFLLIKDIMEKNFNMINENEIINYLTCLKNQGFESTCSFYAKDKMKNLKNTFNHDVYFQLKYCGEYLSRTLDSMVDSRVKFLPDKWQRDLLDIVDRNESALVCCPTSSGKTFISYYVMEKSLRNSHDDVVVFLSPIKALANQVTAEIYARFSSKKYPNNFEKSVFAMSMPDYVINDPLKCQILVTVPTCFESMICDEKNSKWANKVKYVIIDEVQTLNDSDMGASIEKIIHFLNCPVLILSATIGNLDDFYDWLGDVHKMKGIKINKIIHKERFCDLKKFVFKAKTSTSEPAVVGVNELFGYSLKRFIENDLSDDFHFLPGEIVDVLESIKKLVKTPEQEKLFEMLQPEKFFNKVVLDKKSVKDYEKYLVNKIQEYFINKDFEYEDGRQMLDELNAECDKAIDLYESNDNLNEWTKTNIYDLVKTLFDSKMLPAIVFLNTCDECDRMAAALTNYMVNLESSDKKYEKNSKIEEKILKSIKKKRDKNSKENEDNENLEEQSFIPLLDRTKYTFFDPKFRLTDSEIDQEIDEHKHRKIGNIFFEGWKRAIGVHHANYHTKFRSSVECLFRKRHLQIVFATETLSLGLNMPCKTVVMPTDSIYFNPIYYRHMVGRAGRRGFDTIGNIVFYGVPKNKIKNFISSKTSNIKGVYSLNVNLLTQLSMINTYNPNIMKVFNSFINNPIIKLSNKDYDLKTCQRSVYIKIQYLIHRFYLDSNFNPNLDKAKVLILLRNEKIPAMVLIDFLESNFFHKLFSDEMDVEKTANKLCLVFCHFVTFNFFELNQAEVLKLSGNSIILPELNDLCEYLKILNMEIDDYIKNFLDPKDDFDLFKQGFPKFFRIMSLPKNSFIYEFYLTGNLDSVVKNNFVSENNLWFSFKNLRYLSKVIRPLFSKKCENLKNGYDYFSKKVEERFFEIIN